MICVVLGHVTQAYLEGSTYPEANQILYWIRSGVYTFHMPLFMMISGYVYAVTYYENGKPDRRRISRQFCNIVVVYVLFSVAFGLSKIMFKNYTVNETSLKDILLIGIKPIKTYWYLYDLAVFYLLFSIPVFYNADFRMMLGILAVISVIGQFVPFEWFEVPRWLHNALFFYIGVSNKKYPNRLIGNKVIAMPAFIISAILCTVFWDREPYSGIEAHVQLNSIPIANIAIAFGISALLWCMFQNVKWLSTNRILTAIGRYSLEIYVMHAMISPAFRALVSHISFIGPYTSVILNSSLCIIIPMGFSIICKRIGIYEIIFKPATAVSKAKSV